MINYITFKNNEEFNDWQIKGSFDIVQIQPLMMVSNIAGNVKQYKRKNVNIDPKYNVGIFVIYKDRD